MNIPAGPPGCHVLLPVDEFRAKIKKGGSVRKETFWSPYVAGAGLGLTLLAAFYLFGRGLGASGAFSITAAVATRQVSPGFAGGLKYFAKYFAAGSPLMDWIVFEIAGLFIGALAGALLSGSFRFVFEKGLHTGGLTRCVSAFAGGTLIGFASRLARGCTSGVALSGGAQLAVSGWIFVIAMFIGGFAAAAVFRRMWS
jgi:uncharacterized membrane protein YedE/YeeE